MNVAIVERDEGPRPHTNLLDVALEDIRIGLPVQVAFEKQDAEITPPRFRPAA